MELYSTLASICTVLSFVAFIGIVAWAYGGRRKQPFAAAALEPFALPDDPLTRDGPSLQEFRNE